MEEFAAVQRFITLAAGIRDLARLAVLLEEATAELGFDYYALVHHVDLRDRAAGKVVALWSYPTPWVEEYLERQLATSDPVHLASHRTNVGFRWDEMSNLISITAAHRAVKERTRRAGIDEGYTVPANIPGETSGSCSFAMAVGRKLPLRSLQAAHLLGGFAFNAARQLARNDAGEDRLHPRLSPRQLDCLVLVGGGHTDREAARELGLAEDTVTGYLNDARQRFDVSRRTPLVLRAIYDGQIALSDVLKATPPLRRDVQRTSA